MGIDRELGAAGAGLSAGEAQLLSLARVWMRDPDVLVFDEATARIDPQTERQIEAAVARADGRADDAGHRPPIVDAARGRRHHRVRPWRVVEFGDRAELVGDDESRFARLLALALDVDQDDATDHRRRREVIAVMTLDRTDAGPARRRR